MDFLKIFILRNALLNKNAGLHRIITALIKYNEISVISRNREISTETKKEERLFNENTFQHYEIAYLAKMGTGIKNIFNLINYQFKLYKLLKTNRTNLDVIHSFDLDTGLPTLVFSKLYKKKYVYHIADFYVDSRGGIPSLLKFILKKLEFTVINNAEHVIICTDQRKKQIEGASPKKLDVIHNTPVFPSVKYKPFNTKSDILKITYIGTLTENRFIKELVISAQKNQKLHLTIGGMGPLEEWVKNNSNSFENIKYLGKVDYEETFRIYSATDVIVALYNPSIPNHQFSAPNKLYESMALNRPIIVAHNTGVDKIVEEYSLGYVCDYNLESFERIVLQILEKKDDLIEKSIKSANTYPMFSWETMEKKIYAIYANLD